MEMMYDKENDFWWKVEPFDNAGTPDIAYSISDTQDLSNNVMSFSLNSEGDMESCIQKWLYWKKNGFLMPIT